MAALVLASSSLAFAAPATFLTIDHSTETLMDSATAKAMWKDHLSAQIARLYPVAKWGFVSEVEGGFDDGKVCIVTARAMMMPRRGKTLVFKPAKTATAYGTQAGATPQQCQALAKAKLNEAMLAVRAGLLPR
jgi:hypothetical protein